MKVARSANAARPRRTLAIFIAASTLTLAACASGDYEAHLARVEVRNVRCAHARVHAGPCGDPCAAQPCAAPRPARRLISTSGSGGRVLFCNEGGCLARVRGSGPVMIRCGAGGCDVDSRGSGPRLLVCPGGHCSMRCSGSGPCAIAGCRGSCSMRCSGSGPCGQPPAGLLGWLR